MSAIYTSLLVIIFINGGVTAQPELSFVSIEKITEWSTAIFNGINTIQRPNKISGNAESILDNAEDLSTPLIPRMDRKLDAMLISLFNDHELQNLTAKLSHNFHCVDQFYNDSLEYSSGEVYDNSTIVEFTARVLYDPDNLLKLLTEIYDTFIPDSHSHVSQGFLSLVIQRTAKHLPTDCQRSVSPQQLMYYLYARLIITELKGLAVLKQAHTTKWVLSKKNNLVAELNDLRVSFESRVREYYQLFTQHFALLPQQLHRCHVNTPVRGIDFLELQKFSQIKFLEADARKKACDACPHPLMIRDIARRMGTDIYNCMTLSNTVKVCPAESDSTRDYLWWKDETDTNYGRITPCAQETNITAGWYNNSMTAVDSPIVKPCALCICSVDQKWGHRNDDSEIWRISAMEQVSDIGNNMVVTGVKFVAWDNAIHLQIQQAQFSQSGIIHSDNVWKELGTQYHINGTIETRTFMRRHRFTSYMKTMHLDDIKVPSDSVITGVRFVKIGYKAFSLQVHATVFDLETGKLNPAVSSWCDPTVCENETPTGDYKRERIGIKMVQPDDPIRGVAFNYDSESNKMIEFTHTDVYKDGGQTTIPFFDAQPVQATPAFPLSGIGLYYRGKEGFGGYIAPRIYTLDVTNYMKNHQATQEDDNE